MPPFAQVYQDHPPPPPAAPMAPFPGDFDEMHHNMSNLRIETHGDHVNHNSTYQHGFGSPQSPGSTGFPNARGRRQSLSLPAKSKGPVTGGHRMYKFEKYKMPGGNSSWEIVTRTMLNKSEADMKHRVKKPMKQTGRPTAVDFYSNEMKGRRGHKQRQVQQLLYDLQRDDREQRFEWSPELIELHDIKLDKDTGRSGFTKMIVVVKRNPGKGQYLQPAHVFNLKEAIVDLRPHAQHAHQVHSGPIYHHPVEQEQWPEVVHEPNRFQQPQHAGQLFGEDIHDRGDPRITPMHDDHVMQGRHDAQDERRPVQGGKGKDKKEKKRSKSPAIVHAKSDKMYHADSDSSGDQDDLFDVKTQMTSDTEYSTESPGGDKKHYSDKEQKKDKRPLEASREHHRQNPVRYTSESRSRSSKYPRSGDMVIEPHSSRRSGSRYPRGNTTIEPHSSPRAGSRYPRDDMIIEPESSRRAGSRYPQDDMIIEPESSPRRPSFDRNRPSHSRTRSYYNGHDRHPRYERSLVRRRDSGHDRERERPRPRLTQELTIRDEVEIERERRLDAEAALARERWRNKEREEFERRSRYENEYRRPRYLDDDDFVKVPRYR